MSTHGLVGAPLGAAEQHPDEKRVDLIAHPLRVHPRLRVGDVAEWRHLGHVDHVVIIGARRSRRSYRSAATSGRDATKTGRAVTEVQPGVHHMEEIDELLAVPEELVCIK
jgi:hypothetical protein